MVGPEPLTNGWSTLKESRASHSTMKHTWPFLLVVSLAVYGCGKNGAPNSGVATMFELNQALSIMSMGGKHPPASVHELTNFPTLQGKSLPAPPAGRKLAIDRSQNQVVFVDE